MKVTKFHQSYPYSVKATVEYTVGGTLTANAVAEITINTDDASATFKQSNIVTGANTFTVDFASSFGGAPVTTSTQSSRSARYLEFDRRAAFCFASRENADFWYN